MSRVYCLLCMIDIQCGIYKVQNPGGNTMICTKATACRRINYVTRMTTHGHQSGKINRQLLVELSSISRRFKMSMASKYIDLQSNPPSPPTHWKTFSKKNLLFSEQSTVLCCQNALTSLVKRGQSLRSRPFQKRIFIKLAILFVRIALYSYFPLHHNKTKGKV